MKEKFQLPTSNLQSPGIEVQIEELVLHGFELSDRYAIGEAVERELARLLAEQGVPPSFTQEIDIPRLDAGSINLTRNAKPDTIGMQVARSVYQGMGQ